MLIKLSSCSAVLLNRSGVCLVFLLLIMTFNVCPVKGNPTGTRLVLTGLICRQPDTNLIKPLQLAEQMPEFIGGPAALAKFISTNLVYPEKAGKENIQGTIYATFVIDKDGSVIDPGIIKGIGGGCDEEVIRILKAMPKWNPGKQGGVAVPVVYNLPVKFALKFTEIPKTDENPLPKPYTVVQQMPEYPGGIKALNRFLGQNIKYPVEAARNRIQGMVYLTFVVGKEGLISNVRVVRGIGFGCDEEAIRVINLMPGWIPGKQKGEAVPVQFNLPVHYTLK
jgi:TonB family protein